MENVKRNIEGFLSELAAYCESIDRAPREISVLAATKYASVDQIQTALDSGIRVIGENRIQDAQMKFPLLKGDFRRHFIGHLQTNKVRQAVLLFDCVESVDSVRLAEFLDKESKKQSKVLDIYIQVRTSRKMSQCGADIVELDRIIAGMRGLSSLRLRGIMTILPENPEEAGKAAERLQSVFLALAKRNADLDVLSMGMSHDFRIALAHGATELRIGSLFFCE